jgi:hypothetical protein
MNRLDDWSALFEDVLAVPTDAEVRAQIELYRGNTAMVSEAEHAGWVEYWRERGIDEIPARGDFEGWAWFHQKHYRLEHPVPARTPRVRTRRRLSR